ncbi:hypothetical protein CDL15_Pgr028425 [Punica granatum]|uniref:Uncharacterized protein n=1 Tax=Punica granatum TaxID=22663 RepID=A0A218W657_PUNGR|nr:hypothetical protein CDL15_Pgr028425 [Punica granatum]PKI79254.1 hypothetical protein CRG98_000374 [Punica granatum]
MELQYSPLPSSARAKRPWKVLKIIFSVIRRGLISKTKVLMDLNLNLMVKRGHAKLKRKYLMSNFMSRSSRVGSFWVSEYEFSCTNSPSQIFFQANKKKPIFFFPPCLCLPGAASEEDFGIYKPDKVVLVPKIPDYLSNFHIDASFDQAQYEKCHSPTFSPNRVRVSDYLSVDEDDGSDRRVDHEAEEFIKSFYEQLRVQSPINLQY